ncbi:hypothetical protein SISNIDRAFT_496928 [Sistotremastrum niveocremeum HHB9708]|uniref:Alpha-type protein kinase domain-containing protein n=1 Tax=Sistotremastrum niveocremeum HHB9708 TaxID=1314777 RepID=A0A164RL31_9AGAM|nr:hypothetical protein SISNIDRAFT_496928 [Sistotremastrum niveocremeum HHB9708]
MSEPHRHPSHCAGCSGKFPECAFAEGLCPLCFQYDKKKINKDEWKAKRECQCRNCGLSYPMLQGKICDMCLEEEAQDARYMPPPSQTNFASSSHSQGYMDADALYQSHRLNAGPERASTHYPLYSNVNANAEYLALQLGARGPAAKVSTELGFNPPMPRGLSKFQANRTRTQELQESQHRAHATANSVRMVTVVLTKLTYLQSVKPKTPFPAKADGFRTFKKPFPGTTILADAIVTVMQMDGGWSKQWKRMCGVPWEFPEDFQVAWSGGSVIDLKYLQPYGNQDGWSLNQLSLEMGSEKYKDVYVKSADLAERTLRFMLYLDHQSISKAAQKRYENSVRNVSSMVTMPGPSTSTYPAGEVSNKRERSNTQTSPRPSLEMRSPPRKRVANTQPISPIRNAAAERAKRTGQIPLRTLTSLPTRPLIFKAAFTEAYARSFRTWECRPVYEGVISASPFNTNGIQKHVYLLKRDNGHLYVAKTIKAFESAEYWQHYPHVEKENYRASLLTILLTEFQKHAKECQVEIFAMDAASSFIAIEIDGHPPPHTDGDSDVDNDVNPTTPPLTQKPDPPRQPKKLKAYICEPFVPESCRLVKFSGSSTAGNNLDFAGNTADALAHFSVIATKGQVVLADLQGFMKPSNLTEDAPLISKTRSSGIRDVPASTTSCSNTFAERSAKSWVCLPSLLILQTLAADLLQSPLSGFHRPPTRSTSGAAMKT